MRKRPRPDQIAAILRDFQADLDAGLNIGQACRQAGIGPTTYHRWKALQEDPVSNEQLRASELEAEVDRLKLLVAELTLDRRMPQEASKKPDRHGFWGAGRRGDLRRRNGHDPRCITERRWIMAESLATRASRGHRTLCLPFEEESYRRVQAHCKVRIGRLVLDTGGTCTSTTRDGLP